MSSLERSEAYRLIHAQGRDLLALMARAAAVRDEVYGRVITYSRKVFIPLTNLCRDKCAYCTFARAPGDPLAKTLTPEEVLAIARAGEQAGCKEALFSLGERPELAHKSARDALRKLGHPSTLAYLQAMMRLVFQETDLLPHANPGAMTAEEMMELRHWSGSMGMMLENVSERLMEKGQAHFGCPDKAPSRRLQTLRDAGRLRIPFTTGILIGIGETREERVDSLFAIADIHREFGHIQEVIIQNFRRKPDIRFRRRDEPSALEMARTIAAARLILPPEISLQAPPNLTPDAYGLYLLAGINDWGGVSPVTKDHINPEAPWPKIEELAAVTADAGFALRERLTIYPRYLFDAKGYAPPHIRARALRWVDASGLVSSEFSSY
ncbi:MAG: 7,8-didemethyl-8-hydroxy-5-deazariboflavin synthase CofG [Chloroflexi bacterium]|nr:7,8-didemethyl-8-hydroxy-5-deazariboflavin synthase CofG [Chloroflexota bacterium]